LRIVRGAGVSAIAISLTGCAGAHVTNVASENIGSAPPAEILVQVDTTQAPTGHSASMLARVETSLQADLVQQLIRDKVTAEPFVAGTSHPGAAVLHVSVTDADPGNTAERFVIGFGLGSAKLHVTVNLESEDAPPAQRLMTFDTSSSSAVRPGLILPGSIALATLSVAHLAIGGALGVATNANNGIDKPIEQTASAIVKRLKDYYTAVGWIWPASV
jgi:hypothetical protein